MGFSTYTIPEAFHAIENTQLTMQVRLLLKQP